MVKQFRICLYCNQAVVDIDIAAWDLGAGESEVLYFCREGGNVVAIIDDLAARKCASAFSIQLKGTLSILLLARKMGLIPSLKPLIIQLHENGFRIADKLRNLMLRESGELQ